MTALPHPGSSPASGARTGSAATGALPRVGASGRSGIAPLKGQNAALLQVVLFWAGAILLPLGLVVIVLGWYGAANTPYQYDQLSYLVSGGLLGLGLTFTGGFLYFGAWLARIAADGRDSNQRLADTLLLLAEAGASSSAGAVASRDVGAVPVVAGGGTTLHRRDCALIAHRDDLTAAGEADAHLSICRVCRPGER